MNSYNQPINYQQVNQQNQRLIIQQSKPGQIIQNIPNHGFNNDLNHQQQVYRQHITGNSQNNIHKPVNNYPIQNNKNQMIHYIPVAVASQNNRFNVQQISSTKNQYINQQQYKKQSKGIQMNGYQVNNNVKQQQPVLLHTFAKDPKQSPRVYNNPQPTNFQLQPPPQLLVHQTQINNVGLIQPPMLSQNPRQSNATHKQSKSSNHRPTASQLPVLSNSQNQTELRQIVWGDQGQNQAHLITNTFWQQKFFMIFQKFQWFGERFQKIKQYYSQLSELLNKVDSEQQWNDLKQHHLQFSEQLQEMLEELIAVAQQNQLLISQKLGQKNQIDWQSRYSQLLSNFIALKQQKYKMHKQFQNVQSVAQNSNNSGSGNNTTIKTHNSPLPEQSQRQNYQTLLNHCHFVQEQYDKILNQYNSIKQQYENVTESFQKYQQQQRRQSHKNGSTPEQFQKLKMQYQLSMQQVQNQFKNDYVQLQMTCQQLYQEKQMLKQQLQKLQQGKQKVNHKQSNLDQIQHLYKVLEEKQSHVNQLAIENQQIRKEYQRILNKQNQQANKTSSSNAEVSLLNRQIQKLRNQIFQIKNNQKSLIFSIQQQFTNQITHLRMQNQRLSVIYLNVNNQLSSNRIQLQNLLRDNSSSTMSILKYQIQSLQKKINFVEQQNNLLTESLKNKNQEILNLRNISLLLSGYQSLVEKYKILEKQKNKLQENFRKDYQQLNQLKRKNKQITDELQQLRQYNLANKGNNQKLQKIKILQNQITNMKQQINQKDSEIYKTKQIIQCKITYQNQLETENIILSQKIQHLTLVTQNQKNQEKINLQNIKKKLQTSEKRNKTLQLQFKQQITNHYEKQIFQLRKSNQDKYKKINRLQEQLLQIKNKSNYLQKHSTGSFNESQSMKKKCQNLQSLKLQLLANIQSLRKQIKSLNQELYSLKEKDQSIKTQLNTYVIQLQQSDILIRNKNAIIIEYQNQISDFLNKIKLLENIITQQKVKNQQKIKKYQNQIENQNNRRYSKDNQGYNININQGNSRLSVRSNRNLNSPRKDNKKDFIESLQSKLIEQLTQQNNHLRNQIAQLTKKSNSLDSVSRIVATLQDSRKVNKNKSQITVNIQQRLLKFNQRLQNCIQNNQIISAQGVDLTASQRIAHVERQKRQLKIQAEKQIKKLNDRILQLQSQLNSSAAPFNPQLPSDTDIKEMNKYEIMMEQKEKSTLEELQFLKAKFSQQSRTNTALIKLNQQLKNQIQYFAGKNNSNSQLSISMTEYYKVQLLECQSNLTQTQKKLKLYLQQNRKLKNQSLSNFSQLRKQYQMKIFELQMKMKEIERQNSYLLMNKAKHENQRSNLIHDVNVLEADLEAIKTNIANKANQFQKSNYELNNKNQLLQSQAYIIKIGQNNNVPQNNSYGNKIMIQV